MGVSAVNTMLQQPVPGWLLGEDQKWGLLCKHFVPGDSFSGTTERSEGTRSQGAKGEET